MDIVFDPAKNASNQAKHGLRFEDVLLLDWDSAAIRVDDRRAYGEIRHTALAEGPAGLCQVVFTMRRGVMRVISFRRAREKERKCYEQVEESE